jgi:hypothetical protein
MTAPDKYKKHADLFDRTATRLGLDLEELAMAGALSIDEISDAVLRCTECSNPSDCRHWLDRNEGIAEAPPIYCRNQELMDALKKRSQA